MPAPDEPERRSDSVETAPAGTSPIAVGDCIDDPGMTPRADIPVIVFSARDISVADRRRLHDADRILTKTTSLKDVAAELRVLVPAPEDVSAP